MHTGHHDVPEVLQLPCTALSISALVLEVQLLGQRPLQVLGATQAVKCPGQGPTRPQYVQDAAHCSLPVGSGYLQDPAEAEAGVHELDEPEQELQGVDVPVKAVPQVNVLHLCEVRVQGGPAAAATA